MQITIMDMTDYNLPYQKWEIFKGCHASS